MNNIEYLVNPETEIYEPQADKNDLKVKNILRAWDGTNADVVIIGVPFDCAVGLGGGRTGAGDGPDAIRKALRSYGTAYNIDHDAYIGGLKVADMGDVDTVRNNVEETHRRVECVVTEVIKRGMVPVIIGGGHDISYPNIKALTNITEEKVGGINMDAHFDVREVKDGRITSGTPFRRVLEDIDGKSVRGKNFVEIGAHGNLNSRIYFKYLKDKNVQIYTLKEVNRKGIKAVMEEALNAAGKDTEAIFYSVDIDGVAQPFAPGCSAPDAEGFSAEQIRTATYLAGKNPKVRLMDLVETNPRYDIDNRTARLAASIIINFLAGFSKRSKGVIA